MIPRRIIVAAVLAALVLPAPAWAHAVLVRTIPGNGAVILRSPAVIRVVFDDVVRPGPGIAAIRNAGGTSVLAGKARVAGGGRTLVVPLQHRLTNGAYSVRWSIVSDDGHVESGVLAFAVGRGAPAPTAALTAGSNGPQASSLASRWLFFVGLLGAVGIAIYALLARPRDEERVALVLSSSAVLAALGAAEEAHRSGLSTRAGAAFGAGFLAAVVVASLAGAATLAPRVLRPALVLALGLTAVPSVSGHALDRGLNRINVATDILHVAGAAAWVGALLGLVLFLDAPRRQAVQLAAAGVVVLGITGVARALFELVRFSQLWSTSYGQALLVKTGVLGVGLLAGWLLRARIRVRAGAELAIVAGLVVAVSVLVLLRPGRNVEAAVEQRVQAVQPSPQPPRAPRDAVVLARDAGPLGVGLELERARTTAIVISPAGGGLNGLHVSIGGRTAAACGHGCYSIDSAVTGSVDVEIENFGPTLRATFVVPRSTRRAAALVHRASARFRALDSVLYVEHLRSGPTSSLTAVWRLERPNRIAYEIPGGAQGIVIGGHRWDRTKPGDRWQRSVQSPLTQPVPQWTAVTNAYVIAQTSDTTTVTFADPEIPAFFEVLYDRRTLLPRTVHMTAASHFMTDRYVRFNAPRAILPPPSAGG